jgi:4-hydroxy-tetrahydrodipicolinate reductase
VRVRDGHTGAREPGTIGFATLRGGNVIGEHSVIFAGPAERLELRHVADDRTAVRGRRGARRALGQGPEAGALFDMADVLGFNAMQADLAD